MIGIKSNSSPRDIYLFELSSYYYLKKELAKYLFAYSLWSYTQIFVREREYTQPSIKKKEVTFLR